MELLLYILLTLFEPTKPDPKGGTTPLGGVGQTITSLFSSKPKQPEVEIKPPVEAPKPPEINLDHIPGLDDDFYDDLSRKPPQPLPPQNRLGPPGVRPGVSTAPPQAQPEQTGGLLGGLTSGISGLTGGGGVTGKLGDIGGSAAGAAGGLLNSGKGLFKKFGF